MRALLTPEIAPRMGIVLFRPGSELMPLFMQGRVLLEPEPERYSSFASGAVPAASQPLADDPAVRAVFRNEAVIRRAGGVECLESWLLREKGCQWPHSDWHSENMTTMRHARVQSVCAGTAITSCAISSRNGWNQWQRITVPAGCCLLCVGISVLMTVTL